MSYRASFCDPFEPEVIELGDIETRTIIDKFEQTPWAEYLTRMAGVPQKEIHYSPSLEIENNDTKHGLTFSAVGDPDNYTFYIFYKRPKQVRLLFGLIKQNNKGYTTDKTGFTTADCVACLKALLRGDEAYLAGKIGE